MKEDAPEPTVGRGELDAIYERVRLYRLTTSYNDLPQEAKDLLGTLEQYLAVLDEAKGPGKPDDEREHGSQ